MYRLKQHYQLKFIPKMSLNFSSTQTSIFSYEQDCNSLDQRNDILLVNDNKSMKKSESFPFGKW